MLKEQIINGDHCLIYPISEENPIQMFHVGMLTTNPEVRAVPFQCTYVDGKESILFKIHELIPIKKVVETGRRVDFAELMQAMGESIQELMSYQLMPENMLLTEDQLYIDENYKKVYIIYLPLKNGQFDAKNSLTELILKWMDHYLSLNPNTVHPMFVQLMLKLRQDQVSFRSLIEILTKKTEAERSESSIQTAPNTPIQIAPQSVSSLIKPKLMTAIIQPKSLLIGYKAFLIPLIGAIIASLVMILAPFDLNTKAGLALILFAITMAVHQRTKKTLYKKDDKSAFESVISINPKEPESNFNSLNAALESSKSASFETHFGYADETVLIRSHNPAAVLMVRGEDGANYYTIAKEVVTIGRNPSLCDLLLDETGIGRVHAEVHHTQGKYYIKDLQSLNGTHVNGRRITSNQYFELKSGDLIKIGQREVVFS